MNTLRLLAITTLGLALGSAQASTLTLYLDYEFSKGQAPAGSQPPAWLTATFDDGGGTGTVTLTMSASNLTGTEHVSWWGFNVNPTILNPQTFLNITHSSGETATAVKEATVNDPGTGNAGTFKADGDGFFDIVFNFETSNLPTRFTNGETSVYTITGTGITASTFDFSSINGGGNGTYKSAAHVLNTTGVGTGGSGWIGGDENPPQEVVPEPGFYLTLAPGMLGLMYMAYRRRRTA